ncbi:phosphoenolpyruvate synthase [Subsaximicrobium wynnwilliamsii]|uniref:Phosphoenolpyruvate synthase n=1 Tax=Subsaximicrobium wynnwilliamsii TaxID=291179 RepID=A0A5C6ZN82_9FLAO|nr:phosphoenolpyruvate synthase [Subsaximicrobium wynnwilliamsii]TXD84459.1 phosphoenolpyruvate synthase [Subsaximicrobium wynnwilliamsii]TXD90140.1 phosphoenolpyruvate synthase [Subsaximicrobium wynnwilliamsii]TXE04192.1 phosphoenolpyruvate synthase [Subsaximicrobium wynnwilliamsii]
MKSRIKKFSEIGIRDVASVGGKNASLGEMYNELTSKGVRIPNGFATTSFAFWEFLKENNIQTKLETILTQLDRDAYANLKDIGKQARALILSATFSEAFSEEIKNEYTLLCGKDLKEVAVRSSATAEDLPDASFAGQHETYLNVKGGTALLEAVKKCFASLYTNRAIKYREDKGFKHDDVALSVGVQIMVRSDKGCSGVGFTIEPESGFENVILLSGVWGLGENIVQGTVSPDEFYVFKPSLAHNKYPIIQKKLGDKKLTMIYAEADQEKTITNIETPKDKQEQFVLTDNELITLAKWATLIEDHYQKPMDIEWAKDGITSELFITQARPETVHNTRNKNIHIAYKLINKGKLLSQGNAVGSKIAIGKARLLTSPKEADQLTPDTIIVTDTITPDWDPLLKQVAGIVTNKGGRTSHAAIVARELGVPAIVGCGDATQTIKNGDAITLSCAQGKTGYIYQGACAFEEEEIDFSNIILPKTEVKLILADPESAFQLASYPNNGVGLLRMEFIITHHVKVHPMALVKFDQIKDDSVKKAIEKITVTYTDKKDYFIDKLSQGIATIAAAFYPKEVIVRLSDFKTNEYANLIGGKDFEPHEENPMLGFRGASRYYNDLYKDGFVLECKAIKKAREDMGLTNLKIMVPFCRTLEEGRTVVAAMAENDLKRGDKGLGIYTMVEIPSNVILAEQFAEIFDGFSIGSNDLTQLTLGIDRDSELMKDLFDENNDAVKQMIKMAIHSAKKTNTKIGLCGQAPSDSPEFASFLVKEGIDSISFNPDALLQGIENINKAEKDLKKVDEHDDFIFYK